MTPAQRTHANIDQHLKGMDAEEAKLRDLFIVLSNQERKDARMSQGTNPSKRGPGASTVQLTPKKKKTGKSPSVPVVIDSTDDQGSDAEVGASDGSLLPKPNSTLNPKDTNSSCPV